MSSLTNLPCLYKKTSTGALQFWLIRVDSNVIITTWGQIDGAQQIAKDMINGGKNLGKANETSSAQQAQLEAESMWEQKLKKGYVKSLEDAQDDKVDEIITGGVTPMLAHRFDKHGDKVVYPVYVQPKFDGHRCICVIENGKTSLWSRTRKSITGLPHLVHDLDSWAAKNKIKNLVLDGELYNHEYRHNFEELTSFIRNAEPKEGHQIVQYHVYDLVSKEVQGDRLSKLFELLQNAPLSLIGVQTKLINDEDEMMLMFDNFLAQGYEGLMVRNAYGKYVNKRSYDLLKVKEFESSEFVVIGVESGRGKMADKAIFICKTENGVDFRVKMKGSLDDLIQYVENPVLAIDRLLEVQYQGLTGKSEVPRFPVGLRFRDVV